PPEPVRSGRGPQRPLAVDRSLPARDPDSPRVPAGHSWGAPRCPGGAAADGRPLAGRHRGPPLQRHAPPPGAGGPCGAPGFRGLHRRIPAQPRASPAPSGRGRAAPTGLGTTLKPAGVIFDLDGTLADTLGDIAAAMNRTLRAHGFPVHPVDAYRTFVGEGVRRLVERALPPGTEDRREAFLAAYQADYAEHMLDVTVLFPGIPAVLDALGRAKVPVAVLSNKTDGATRRLVETLCGRWDIRETMGERPGVPRKPDPAAALSLADARGAPPERVTLVGDTAVDMLTARSAGMRPVGVLWGFRPREVLDSGAEAAGTAEELAALLGVGG